MATVYKLVLATRNLEFCFSSMAGTDKVEYACDPVGQESCIGTRPRTCRGETSVSPRRNKRNKMTLELSLKSDDTMSSDLHENVTQ